MIGSSATNALNEDPHVQFRRGRQHAIVEAEALGLGNDSLSDHVHWRNPVLDQLLPSWLHVKAVAVPDAGLKRALTDRGLKYRGAGERQALLCLLSVLAAESP